MISEIIRTIRRGERPDDFGAIKPGHPVIRAYAEGAYDGSLDAAWKLHDELLPEWQARPIIGAAGAGVTAWHCTVEDWDGGDEVDANNMPCPARAWLLATLMAYSQKGARDDH